MSSLNVKNLNVTINGSHILQGVDFQVPENKVTALLGRNGVGKSTTLKAIMGLHESTGSITFGETEVVGMQTHKIVHLGMGYVPEDREKHGLVANYSIADNLVLNQFDQEPFAKGWVRNLGEVANNALSLVEKFDIRTPSAFNTAGSLSGGNKQKVVVARELSQELPVLVAAQPTRGVDVGSIEFIHNQLIAARDKGAGVLLVSAELDEVLSLSDRIAVMSDGKIVAIVDSKDADRNYIGRLMAGLKE